MNLLHLALANIKKRKSATISLLLLVILASLLLNTGLSILTKLDTFYSQKTHELNGAQFVAVATTNENTNKQIEFLQNNSNVKQLEHEESYLFQGLEIPYGKGHMTTATTILNKDIKRTLSPLELVEESKAIKENRIYVPYIFKTGGGYTVGDTFRLKYGNQQYTYTIAGFFETTLLGNTMGGIFKFFLPEEEYNELGKKLNAADHSTYIAATVADEEKLSDLSKSFSKAFPSTGLLSDVKVDTKSSEISYMMPIKTVSIILISFAFIMLVVALVVVKFRVTNTIDDDIGNIGSLKAMGYTSNQVLYSMVLQFMMITGIGSIIGILLSYLALPFLGNIISSSIGLLWTQTINLWINLVCLLLISFLVFIVVGLAGLKIRNISPIIALRGGVLTHCFTKNRFALDRTKGNLQFTLGLKNMYSNRKQNYWVMLIIIILTFACVFTSVLYYNFSFDKTSIYKLAGSEEANLVLIAKEEAKADDIFSAIKKMDGIEKTGMLAQKSANVNGQSSLLYVSDDYSQIDWHTAYEGRQPRYDNEIAISGVIAKDQGKKIGDTIKVTLDNHTKEYLITGLTQQFSDGNNMPSSLTLEGYQHLLPSYKKDTLSIYLKDNVKTNDFAKEITTKFGDQLIIGNIDAAFSSQMGSINAAIAYVMILIVVITLLAVSLILYLIIKTMIIKRKRELGIYKALGYTTYQLMTQITFSFLPVVILAVTLGGLLGSLFTNSILSILFSSLGIFNSVFRVNMPIIIVLCIGILLFSYIICILVTRRIKKISAHGLLTD